MIAVDTNIVVRMLVGDDREQAKKARNLFENQQIFITSTVLLETEWVLRSAYEFERKAILRAFTALCGLKQVTLDQPEIINNALAGYETGLDFADALHLCASNRADQFVTFDKKLIKAAKVISRSIAVVEP